MPLIHPSFRIVLASQSPRRKELLQAAGLPFVVKTCPVEEDYPDELPVEQVAEYLAIKKARAAAHLRETEQDILLSADSVVILDGEIFGKPDTPEQATAMLQRLSGRTHLVITGVCMLYGDQTHSFSDHAHVTFAPLSAEEIAYYLDTCRPYDKAGSYGIQEWIGLCKIVRLEGTFANVMGLPVARVWEALNSLLQSPAHE